MVELKLRRERNAVAGSPVQEDERYWFISRKNQYRITGHDLIAAGYETLPKAINIRMNVEILPRNP